MGCDAVGLSSSANCFVLGRIRARKCVFYGVSTGIVGAEPRLCHDFKSPSGTFSRSKRPQPKMVSIKTVLVRSPLRQNNVDNFFASTRSSHENVDRSRGLVPVVLVVPSSSPVTWRPKLITVLGYAAVRINTQPSQRRCAIVRSFLLLRLLALDLGGTTKHLLLVLALLPCC